MKTLLLIEPGPVLRKANVTALLGQGFDLYVAAGEDRTWVTEGNPLIDDTPQEDQVVL